MKISVVGLGKLGSPLAAVLAAKGHTVIGFDINPDAVDKLSRGISPVDEPGLQAMIDDAGGRLSATTDIEVAVHGSDLTFIIVPTPSNAEGVFTNEHVIASVERIGQALKGKADYHVVNVTSTVMPGSCDGEIRAALERASGRTVGHDVGLCYNPEFIALGSVIRDMLHPDMLLIGESDERAGALLEQAYRSVCLDAPPVRRMNLVNAEVIKISINTYVTTKISYANMLSDLCERLPGADVDVVTQALGCDSRIGGKYLKGALGYGGPCFPRDNIAFSRLARQVGAEPLIAEATDRINSLQVERLARKVLALLPPGGSVGILGLSYKPDTGVVERSQGVELAELLAGDVGRVMTYDPKAMGAAVAVLGKRVEFFSSAQAVAEAADVLVITTPWPEFRSLLLRSLQRQGTPLAVVDCWRVLNVETYGEVCRLIHLGRGPSLPS